MKSRFAADAYPTQLAIAQLFVLAKTLPPKTLLKKTVVSPQFHRSLNHQSPNLLRQEGRIVDLPDGNEQYRYELQ
jgi:hypothetical protein